MTIGETVQNIFDQHGVDYVQHGQSQNVARGNINIQCPYCGDDDPSHHMGISLSTGAYGCWRSPTHKGRDPAFLLARVLRTTVGDARGMLGFFEDETDLDRIASGEVFREGEQEAEESNRPAPFTDDELVRAFRLRKIKSDMLTSRFVAYLRRQRGFESYAGDGPHARTRDDSRKVVKRYGLYCGITGYFKNRVVMPVRDEAGLVQAVTSRSLHRNAELRYKGLPEKKPTESCSVVSPVPIKSTLYNMDRAARGGEVLVVTEGPFDAIKVDLYGHRRGVSAVALFNMTPSADQASLLYDLSKKFDRVVLAFDAECEMQAHEAASSLVLSAPVELVTTYPGGRKDPGDMLPEEADEFVGAL